MRDTFNEQFAQVRNSGLILLIAFSAPKNPLTKTRLSPFAERSAIAERGNDRNRRNHVSRNTRFASTQLSTRKMYVDSNLAALSPSASNLRLHTACVFAGSSGEVDGAASSGSDHDGLLYRERLRMTQSFNRVGNAPRVGSILTASAIAARWARG